MRNAHILLNLVIAYYYMPGDDYYNDVKKAMDELSVVLQQTTNGYFQLNQVGIFGTTNSFQFNYLNNPAFAPLFDICMI